MLCWIALILFVVQMVFAIMRFADDQTMFATETIDILDVAQVPVVTICPAPRFDYVSALKMGYKGKTAFFSGKPNGTMFYPGQAILENHMMMLYRFCGLKCWQIMKRLQWMTITGRNLNLNHKPF